MSLADFMMPEVAPMPVNLRDLASPAPPSRMFCGYDPAAELLLVEGVLVPAASPVQALSSDGYKSHRNVNFVASLPQPLKLTVLWDMEDARAFDAALYFGRDYNLFQYNRRQGSRYAVLWRLRAYFEPSRNIGHPGVIIEDELTFDQKKPKVFWRGSLAGSRWLDPQHRVGPLALKSVEEFVAAASHFSRLRAVLDARDSDVCDFKLTGGLLETRPWLAPLNVVGEPASPPEQLTHKYILCPNGNDVSSSLYWVLSTNSLAFREECSYEVLPDYFLKPWIHYVPIARGLVDLEEKYEFCESNADLCTRIIANAQIAYRQMTDEAQWRNAELEVLNRLALI